MVQATIGLAMRKRRLGVALAGAEWRPSQERQGAHAFSRWGDRRLRSLLVGVFFLLSAFTNIGSLNAQPLPVGDPESLGFSPQRLERLHETLARFVDDQRHAGIISLIARDGQIVDWWTHGHRNRRADAPMERDTICRIYSMTKLVTTTAVMILFEEGRIGLDDRIDRYIPALREPKVMTGGTVSDPELVDAERPVTIRHLLTHTSGYTYGFVGVGPIHELYEEADLWNAGSLEEFIERVSDLPLRHQPGEAWAYGISLDILGYLVEVVSEQDFEDFLRERIFDPLGMEDTAFHVPKDKRDRLARLYEQGDDGLQEAEEPILGAYVDAGEGIPSGGAGLFGTIGDYLRFAQMLLNGGELDGERLLSPKTVELMMVNHLGLLEDPTITWSDSEGFGFGGAVRIRLAQGASPGSIGQFGWYGAATTYFNLDPREETVVLLFTQHLPFNEHGVFARFSTGFYQAMIE